MKHFFKKALAAAALALSLSVPVRAVPTTMQFGGVDPANTFGFNGTLTNTAHKVTFGTNSAGATISLGTVSVKNLSTTASTYLFVQTNGTTASGSSAEIQLGPGDFYTYEGQPLSSISVYTTGTSVPYTVGGN